MKKGDFLVYCGETELHYTKNKRYKINGYVNLRDAKFFNITDDLSINVMIPYSNYNFKLEKELRKEKLKKLNESRRLFNIFW